MRIISGQWRSRPLIAPKGDTTRPTADRTRETLFSMLTSRLGSFEDLRVLDLLQDLARLGLRHCRVVPRIAPLSSRTRLPLTHFKQTSRN
jgi:hypothetical protein